MKLVFYSGGDHFKNEIIDRALLSLVMRKQFRMTYIPSCREDRKESFRHFKWYFRKYRVKEFHCLAVDQRFTRAQLAKALKSDIIYLSGGNTYFFLRSLRRSGMMLRLRDYVNGGGILAGSSAGAIIMTPDINTAAKPTFDCDDNEIGMRNLKALNFVRFEFVPHYRKSKRFDAEMKSYSKKLNYPLYACKDGSGIVINGRQSTFVGDVIVFIKGHKMGVGRLSHE